MYRSDPAPARARASDQQRPNRTDTAPMVGRAAGGTATATENIAFLPSTCLPVGKPTCSQPAPDGKCYVQIGNLGKIER